MAVEKDLGKVTAYAYAKAAGYTGTEEQFQQVFNEFTENAPGLLDRLDDAVADAEAAQAAAQTAVTNANTAKNAAEAAQAAAQQTAQDMDDSVQQITTNKNDISDLKESISEQSEAIDGLYEDYMSFDIVEGQYISSSTGNFGNSGGDARTGFIHIPSGTKEIIVISPESTIYNAYYSSNSDQSKVAGSSLKLVVGENHLIPPIGANYFALSMSKANMINTKIKTFISSKVDILGITQKNDELGLTMVGAGVLTPLGDRAYNFTSGTLDSTTGEESATQTSVRTDFIIVPDGMNFAWDVTNATFVVYMFEYDKNRTFLRRRTAGDEFGLTYKNSSLDARYVRIVLYQGSSAISVNDLEDYFIGKLLSFRQLENRFFRATGNLSSNGTIQFLNKYTQAIDNHIMTNKHLSFMAKVSQMGTFEVHHGDSEYGSSWITVDSTQIKCYLKESGSATLVETVNHGLTIGNTVGVTIDADDNWKAIVRLYSDGNWYEHQFDWDGMNGKVFVKSVNATLLDCVLSWTCDGFWKDIQLYGDSYFGLTGGYRWTYYAKEDGYLKNCLVDGFPGNYSTSGLATFKTNIQNNVPKYAVFCLGMNDPDSESSVNSDWKTSVDSFLEICDGYGIIPILATIPSAVGGEVDDTDITTMRINKYKNAYVRASGRRYIDFDKAVVANENTGEWYPGMLSDDGVHPTQAGAKALYMAVLTDFPEIQH